MGDIVNHESLYIVVAFILPGLIASYVRSQFLSGRIQSQSESILTYLTLSLVYAGMVIPIFGEFPGTTVDGSRDGLLWFAIIFIGPAAFGGVLGFIAQQGPGRRILRRWGINSDHVIPSAWDWRFSSLEECWVMITLKNETKFAGYCGQNSFMSSDPSERDMFIEHVFAVGDDDTWKSCPGKSLLVTSGEISTIEFWRIERQLQ